MVLIKKQNCFLWVFWEDKSVPYFECNQYKCKTVRENDKDKWGQLGVNKIGMWIFLLGIVNQKLIAKPFPRHGKYL